MPGADHTASGILCDDELLVMRLEERTRRWARATFVRLTLLDAIDQRQPIMLLAPLCTRFCALPEAFL
jgi:hypothetical protein